MDSLPAEVWYVVLVHIFGLRDYHNLRLVCKEWYELLKDILRHRIRQRMWILHKQGYRGLNVVHPDMCSVLIMAFYLGDMEKELCAADKYLEHLLLNIPLPPILEAPVEPTFFEYLAYLFESRKVTLRNSIGSTRIEDLRQKYEADHCRYLGISCVLGYVYVKKLLSVRKQIIVSNTVDVRIKKTDISYAHTDKIIIPQGSVDEPIQENPEFDQWIRQLKTIQDQKEMIRYHATLSGEDVNFGDLTEQEEILISLINKGI